MLGGIIFFMQMLVKYILPQFEPGLASMKILLFGFYFLVLGGIFPNVIFTINRQIFLLPLYFVSIAISVVLNYIFIKLGWGIEGVALGTSISYFLFFLIISLYASKFFLKKGEILKIYLFVFLYFLYFLIGITLIARLSIGGEELFKLIVRCLILGIISLPVFFQIQRREKFFTSLLGILKKKK
jgi:O-antigen/teichoic acid export membrane protein